MKGLLQFCPRRPELRKTNTHVLGKLALVPTHHTGAIESHLPEDGKAVQDLGNECSIQV